MLNLRFALVIQNRYEKIQNILEEKGDIVVKTTDEDFSSKRYRNLLSNSVSNTKSGLNWFKLSGGSMRPFLRTGRIVPVLSADKYCPGDVVAYCINNKNYIHRIMRQHKDLYFIVDDVNISRGHWVKAENISGKVVGVPFSGIYGKFWNIFARNIYSAVRWCKYTVLRLNKGEIIGEY